MILMHESVFHGYECYRTYLPLGCSIICSTKSRLSIIATAWDKGLRSIVIYAKAIFWLYTALSRHLVWSQVSLLTQLWPFCEGFSMVTVLQNFVTYDHVWLCRGGFNSNRDVIMQLLINLIIIYACWCFDEPLVSYVNLS